MIVSVVQIVLVLLVGAIGYGVSGPHEVLEFILVLIVGMLSFTALGVGISTLVPNADAAGPIVSLVFFILMAFSGLYYPVKPGCGLANFTDIFPIRHLILASVDTFNGIPGTSSGMTCWSSSSGVSAGVLWPFAVGSGRPSSGLNRSEATQRPPSTPSRPTRPVPRTRPADADEAPGETAALEEVPWNLTCRQVASRRLRRHPSRAARGHHLVGQRS